MTSGKKTLGKKNVRKESGFKLSSVMGKLFARSGSLTDRQIGLVSQGTLGFEYFSYISLALILIIAGLFSLPNYNMLLSADNPFSKLPTSWILLIGFAVLAGFWRLVPVVREESWDLEKWTARSFFWIFIVLGFVLRMQHPERPVGFFWDDHYVVITDIRNILEYKERPILFPFGWREPLFPYLTAFLWVFIPKASGIYIVNLSSTVVDLATLWVSYLVGKEIGGRRMGLLLMGMEVISKPMIAMSKFGYGNGTSVLGCAVATLFFFRLLKKADLRHFIQWGLALGFGSLCYVPYRPWTPVMLGAVWLWVYSDVKERKFDFFRIVIGPGLLAAWAFLFLYKNCFITQDNRIVALLTGPVVLTVVALLLAACCVKIAMEEIRPNKKNSKLFGWAIGALVTALVMSPFLIQPNYSSHTSDISIFSKRYADSLGAGFHNLWNNLIFVQGLMFGQVGDVARIPALGDSFFDFYTAVCGLLGLAYFVARPSWIKAYMIALFLVSQSTAVLANGPHSLRFAAIVFPVLLVGAWGLNRFWLLFLQTMPSKMGNLACGLLLLVAGGWVVDRNTKLIREWLEQKSPDLTIADTVEKELPNHRVYLVRHHPGFYTNCQDALCEDKEVYRMNDSNPIDLLPGEKCKDLSIVLAGQDIENQKRVEKAFPGITWSSQMMWNQGPKEIPFIKYTEVPFDRVKESATGLFHIRRVDPWTWRRRCYGRDGLGHGFILYEDRVARWNDDLPPHDTIDWDNSMRIEGEWNVKQAGDYIFKLNTANVFYFFLDGNKVLDVAPKQGYSALVKKVSLAAGPHHVELLMSFASEHRVPKVSVIAPGSMAEVPFDDFAVSTVSAGTPINVPNKRKD